MQREMTHAEHKLDEVEQKINDLCSSDEYKRLKKIYGRKENTAGNDDHEYEVWIEMQEQLTRLQKKEEFWQKAILNSQGTVELGSQSATSKPRAATLQLNEVVQNIRDLLSSSENVATTSSEDRASKKRKTGMFIFEWSFRTGAK